MAEKTPTFQIQAFGNYFLLERIAVGGMAEIFKAKQVGVRGFEKIVVIKKILNHLSEDPEFVEMFEDEARIAAQLSQANIVQIYELGEVEGTLYITMEFVDGKNMRDLTKAIQIKHIHLSVEQVLYMMIETLKGLDYAHRKSDSKGNALELVHRDISPQNIILSYEGEVKILDFGIAKAASKISKTEAGVLKGKFSYMSPEQAGGKQIDQRSDIYACGVIAHELLTSERLFRAKSDTETLDRVKEGHVDAPSQKNPLIPPELDEIILKALAKNPRDRYQTAGDFLNDLSKCALTLAYNYSSKEMSAFLKTLFAATIDDERHRLNEALSRLPEKEIVASTQIKTRIAFKAEPVAKAGNEKPDDRSEITSSIVKRRSLFPLIRKPIVASAILFGLLSLVFLFVRKVPERHIESENSSPPMPSKAPSPTPMDPIRIAPIPEPRESGNPKIQNLLDTLQNESAPSTEETQKPPKSKPSMTPQPSGKNHVEVKATKGATPATVNVVAPPEGYADLLVDKKNMGTVPGPQARGISLSAGVHTIECRAPGRAYYGQITVESGQKITIRCQDLEE